MGDPILDIDDVDGYGPENINIDTVLYGTYLLSIFHYSGSVSPGNTVRIYLYGQLAGEFYRQLNAYDWWEVALIHWPKPGQGVPCIEDLSTEELECEASRGLAVSSPNPPVTRESN